MSRHHAGQGVWPGAGQRGWWPRAPRPGAEAPRRLRCARAPCCPRRPQPGRQAPRWLPGLFFIHERGKVRPSQPLPARSQHWASQARGPPAGQPAVDSWPWPQPRAPEPAGAGRLMVLEELGRRRGRAGGSRCSGAEAVAGSLRSWRGRRRPRCLPEGLRVAQASIHLSCAPFSTVC